MMKPHSNAATDSLDVEGFEAGDVRAPRRMKTDRLVLRRVHSDEIDLDRLHALFAGVDDSAAVFELCGWDEHDDEAETRSYLRQRTERWERGEQHEYVLAADDEYVGTAVIEVSDDGSGEFGFWLRRTYWGRGLCGEGTDALVHAAFECLDAPFVVAGCLPANDRSRRAIEKFVRRYGGAYYGSPPTVPSRYRDAENRAREQVVPHHEWVITRDQYAAGDNGLSALVPDVEYDALDF